MKKCVLHIGMHKTGSTSIQKSLHGWEDDQFCYAKISSPNHSQAFNAIFSQKNLKISDPEQANKIKIDSVDQYRSTINNHNDRTVIFSAESLSQYPRGAVRDVSKFLAEHFESVTVYAYVRPPASYMTSAFQERVKNEIGSIPDFRKYRSYRNCFEKFDSVFGVNQVRLYKFSPGSLVDGNVVTDFCHNIGLSFPKEKIIRSNDSLSRQKIALLYTYSCFRKKAGYDWIRMGVVNSISALLDPVGSDRFQISNQVIKPMLMANKEDITWMEQRLGASLAEDMEKEIPGATRSTDELIDEAVSLCDRLREIVYKHTGIEVSGSPSPELVATLMATIALRDRKPKNIRIQKVDHDKIVGWAFAANLMEPATVIIRIDGVECGRVRADHMRPGMAARGMHPTGQCGFVFKIPAPYQGLEPGRFDCVVAE